MPARSRPIRPTKGILTARDLMTRAVHTIRADVPIEKAVATLTRRGVSALPVVDRDGRVIGMISEGDLFRRRELGTNSRRRKGWLEILVNVDRLARDYIRSHARTVRDVMTTKVVSATEDTSAAEIADMLEAHRIKRLPVTRDGKLVGIVSRADLVRALVKRPGKPRKAVDARVIQEAFLQRLRRQPWTVGASVNIVVSDGVVELWGNVATEEQARALGVMAESIAGVTGVRNRLKAGRKSRG
ncbi:MAG: CBS domain-containing protein [Alphaproteobacteria bacterium]